MALSCISTAVEMRLHCHCLCTCCTSTINSGRLMGILCTFKVLAYTEAAGAVLCLIGRICCDRLSATMMATQDPLWQSKSMQRLLSCYPHQQCMSCTALSCNSGCKRHLSDKFCAVALLAQPSSGPGSYWWSMSKPLLQVTLHGYPARQCCRKSWLGWLRNSIPMPYISCVIVTRNLPVCLGLALGE